jgi:mRNA interferase MazF
MKEFNTWNKTKIEINEGATGPFYNEREIWWCALGVNVGFEQDGTGKNFDRPIVILRGFNKNTFLAVALTGRKKEGKFYYYLGEIEGREASAVLSQIRLFDTKRLIRKIGTMDEKLFSELKKRMRLLLFDD